MPKIVKTKTLSERQAWKLIGQAWEKPKSALAAPYLTTVQTSNGLCYSTDGLRYGARITHETHQSMGKRLKEVTAISEERGEMYDMWYLAPKGKERGARAMLAYFFAEECK